MLCAAFHDRKEVNMQAYDDAEAGVMEAWGMVPAEAKTQALNGGWYRESRRTARALARKHGVTLSCSAGVIAALSPRIKWNSNVLGADHILGGGDTGPGFNRNVEKACRIRDGERPLRVLGGPKVTAFYRAIMGDQNAAVIDVWMWRAMGLAPGELKYEEAEAVLRRAAEQAGVSVSSFQALVWTQVRGGAT
jgi:hypothetical protein